ncbi:ribosome maturation factor RimM [Tepidimicrobium xylanilyticum]|uniref:Ribosome maturation factor RimM n=2 Tax=Tepidimicrobium xylanilyticum TaxID=1123352 RepID=A0A1H2YMP3_9FIRM|nr:16S rRNA processing protein RimM [Tepidimicrobium xylanilyticum]
MVGENMDYIKIGWIMNTHGIKGELKVYPLTYDINRFNDLKKVYIGNNKIEAEIERVKYSKGLTILKFKEFNNINDVLKFKKDYIYIDEKDRVELPDDHFFVFDIIDCTVYTIKGHKVGTVTDVLQMASNDVYVVKDVENGKEYLIPAVKEFVVDIDIKNKKIVIDPIEGMIE